MMNDDLLIFENSHFRVEQSSSVPIPGYLIVIPKNRMDRFSNMAASTADALGRTLFEACRAVEAVIESDRVYVARFGEETKDVHFHIFPRTAWLLAEFRDAHRLPSSPISGPLLFDWAREVFKRDSGKTAPGIDLEEAVGRMRLFVESGRTGESS